MQMTRQTGGVQNVASHMTLRHIVCPCQHDRHFRHLPLLLDFSTCEPDSEPGLMQIMLVTLLQDTIHVLIHV